MNIDTSVVAVYETIEAAEEAVRRLDRDGFLIRQVSIVARDLTSERGGGALAASTGPGDMIDPRASHEDYGIMVALYLIERLIDTMELREAVNPDVPAPVLDEEIRTLEHQLTCVLEATMGWRIQRYDGDPTRPRRPDA